MAIYGHGPSKSYMTDDGKVLLVTKNTAQSLDAGERIDFTNWRGEVYAHAWLVENNRVHYEPVSGVDKPSFAQLWES